MNLRMLVLAGGRERTIDHYSALAATAGLQVTAVHDITERHVIIECASVRPAQSRVLARRGDGAGRSAKPGLD
jgi:hypothetical protein